MRRHATYARGEKWATQLFTDMLVGKAMPAWRNQKVSCMYAGCLRVISIPFGTFTPFTDLLYTAPVPSSRSLSPSTHRSRILAPSTHFSTSFFITLCTISAATYEHHICAHRSAYKISAKKRKIRANLVLGHIDLRRRTGLFLRWLRLGSRHGSS